jgi:hypothetical protein
MTGYLIFYYVDRYAGGVAQLAKWLRSGERSREHVVAGDVNDFPEILLTLFRGENTGTLVLALSPDHAEHGWIPSSSRTAADVFRAETAAARCGVRSFPGRLG